MDLGLPTGGIGGGLPTGPLFSAFQGGLIPDTAQGAERDRQMGMRTGNFPASYPSRGNQGYGYGAYGPMLAQGGALTGLLLQRLMSALGGGRGRQQMQQQPAYGGSPFAPGYGYGQRPSGGGGGGGGASSSGSQFNGTIPGGGHMNYNVPNPLENAPLAKGSDALQQLGQSPDAWQPQAGTNSSGIWDAQTYNGNQGLSAGPAQSLTTDDTAALRAAVGPTNMLTREVLPGSGLTGVSNMPDLPILPMGLTGQSSGLPGATGGLNINQGTNISDIVNDPNKLAQVTSGDMNYVKQTFPASDYKQLSNAMDNYVAPQSGSGGTQQASGTGAVNGVNPFPGGYSANANGTGGDGIYPSGTLPGLSMGVGSPSNGLPLSIAGQAADLFNSGSRYTPQPFGLASGLDAGQTWGNAMNAGTYGPPSPFAAGWGAYDTSGGDGGGDD